MQSMPRTSAPSPRKTPTDKERSDLRRRVGAFVRTRREQLGLSQGDIITMLGYVSRNSVSNIETGREGLPAKRIFAWADVLEVPRDAFYRFVTGETKRLETTGKATEAQVTPKLLTGESELLAAFRKLPLRHQRRLREQIKELSSTGTREARTPAKAPARAPAKKRAR